MIAREENLENTHASSSKIEYFLVGLFILAYTVVTSRYLLNAHDNFYTFHNLAEFENWYWQFLHGQPFATSLPKPSPHLYFGQLILLPFYALWTDVKTLLIGRSLWIALGAVPTYFISRSFFQTSIVRILTVACYCLNPIIIMTHFNQYFSAEPFVIPVFLLSLYAAIEKRTILLCVSLAFACLVREDMALTVIAMGFFVFFSNRQRRLGLIISLFALTYFVLSIKFIAPFMFNMNNYIPTGGYGYDYLGHDVTGIVVGAIKHPDRILGTIFNYGRLKYLGIIFISVGFLPFAALDIIAAGLPAILINVISKNPEQVDPYSMYVGPVIPFIVASAVVGLKRICSKTRNYSRMAMLLLLLVLSLDCLILLLTKIPENRLFAPHREASRLAVAAVPEKASITATPNFLPHLSQRRCLYDFIQNEKSEYYLIETNETHWITRWLKENGNYQNRIDEVMADERNELLFNKDGIYLLRNNSIETDCR